MAANKAYNHREFMNYLLEGNHKKSMDYVNDFLKKEHNIELLYEEIIKEALYEIGRLWETNKISIATEHLASAITETVLNSIYLEHLPVTDETKSVIVCSVQNERHQIGQKMVADIFETHGWHTNALGADTTSDDILHFTQTSKPNIIAISVSLYFNLPQLDDMLQKIKAALPEQMILVGGQAFTHGRQDIVMKYFNVFYIKNLKQLSNFIKNH